MNRLQPQIALFRSQRQLTGKSDSVQVVENNLLHLLVNLFLLSQDNISFPFNSTLLQLGVLEDIRDDSNSRSNILLESFGVIDGLFSRSVGVEVSSNVLYFEFERSLISGLGSLESHVLTERVA